MGCLWQSVFASVGWMRVVDTREYLCVNSAIMENRASKFCVDLCDEDVL